MQARQLLSAIAICAAAAVGHADSQAQLAARDNARGEAALQAKRYSDASRSFEDAIARVPDPRYFYNLCTSGFEDAKLVDAIHACKAVASNSPLAALVAKTNALIVKIREQAKRTRVDLPE